MTTNLAATDYRYLLKQKIQELKKRPDLAISIQSVADATRVQRPYLSNVLNGRQNLSPDQLYLVMDCLALELEEREYIELLYQEQRSALASRKKHLQKKIFEKQQKKLQTENALQSKVLETDDELSLEYFTNPSLQLVHMLLTVDHFRKNISSISERTHLQASEVKQSIQRLIAMNLLQFESGSYRLTQKQFFLGANSPVHRVHHNLQKATALPRLESLNRDQRYSLSLQYSCGEKTQKEIREVFVDAMQKVESLVKTEKHPTNVYQLSMDLFPWVSP